MEENEFKRCLKEHKITVVHFSHLAEMNHKVEFPNDLQHAIDNYQTEQRSCCAIFPGYKMDLPGSVGVIFEPEFTQVISVCNSDSGSSDLGSLGVSPDPKSIRESLQTDQNVYNEWVLIGAKPIGIFISNHQCIPVKKAQKLSINGDEEEIVYGTVLTSVDNVKKAFPQLQIFTMGKEGLEKL